MVAAACCALSPAATLAGAGQPTVEIGEAAASEALAEAEEALDPAGAEPAADPTLALGALSTAVPALEGGERLRARGLLARPTDGAADRYGDGYPAAAPVSSASSAHFCAFFVTDPAFTDAPDLTDANGISDGDGVPDYVEAILEIAEHSRSVEVAPGPLAWLPPKPDLDGCGADPSARADVYIKQLGDQGFFGYESPDPGQGAVRSKYGYMVLDDDYARSEFGFPVPLDAARVTFAHEYNHLLQQNYDSLQDTWLFEATAVWAEEKVYPAIDDYVNYVHAFASSPGSPITDANAADGLKMYGSGVWNHWLSGTGGGYGDDSIRAAWELSPSTDPADFAVAAYDRAIRAGGGKGFEREFLRFAAASAEWRTGYGGFPDAAQYPDIKRKGSLGAGSEREFKLDHTAFRMLDVHAGGQREITLKVRAEDGVRSGIALVARDGSPTGGAVVKRARYLSKGAGGRVTLESPAESERITAVVVNADARVRGQKVADWDYRKDNRRFTVKLIG